MGRGSASGGIPANARTASEEGDDAAGRTAHAAQALRYPAPSKPRAGKAAEDALADVLSGPYVVLPFAAWIRAPHVRPDIIVREFEWGIGLVPRRRFRCDFLHLTSATMVEIEGGAHGVQRQRKSDILRTQLAQQAGYRIVRVLPEQVHNGEALALVRRELGGE